MAEKNDPTIYDDRSTIGSSDELDEYGVWVKSEPQDLSTSLPDMEELPDFSDFTQDAPAETPAESPDLPIDELEFEEIPEASELPDGLAPTSIDKDGFTEVSMDDFIDSETPLGIDFGDLDSTVPEIVETSDFTEDPPAAAAVPAVAAAAPVSAASDLSTQLLTKIADELSSIRTELSSLKKELASVRGSEARSESGEPGFFDEEDDEKIALTGDELENILNTANFTEEAGSDQGDTVESSISLPGEGEESPPQESIELNLEDEAPELSPFSPPDDEKDLIGDNFDVSLDLDTDLDNLDGDLPDFTASPELDTLRETGAEPLTPPPEDTGYLEEDPLANLDDHVDLSGAVIDAPDLSASISENPVLEPSLDDIGDIGDIDNLDNIDNISIDLEMEEAPAAKESLPDDFSFETEEIMEIPDLSETSVTVPENEADFGDSFNISDEPDKESPDLGVPPATEDLPPAVDALPAGEAENGIPGNLKQELKTVLSYMDQLLESLPEDKIEEFAKSEYFDTYKKLFEELGLV
ncbi:MAG: hypothetical protein LBJ31_11015 [Treponema sp.]|jgi:hypothetical protein|nr:hypothetical protein [Treponema sp.]